jgi:hypothetical protein
MNHWEELQAARREVAELENYFRTHKREIVGVTEEGWIGRKLDPRFEDLLRAWNRLDALECTHGNPQQLRIYNFLKENPHATVEQIVAFYEKRKKRLKDETHRNN